MSTTEKENDEYMVTENGQAVKWYQSKKFIGYSLGELGHKLTLFISFYIIAQYQDGVMSGSWLTFLFAVVVTAGVAQMGFLGGQAWIDRYTKAIKIPATLGSSVVGTMKEAFDGHPDQKNDQAPVPAPAPVAAIPTAPEADEEEEEVTDEEEPQDDTEK
jgi:hypothetical protein